MRKKDVEAETNVPADVKTTRPADEDTDCIYCYLDDKRCSPGTIANFAGQRRECVIVDGHGKWKDFNLASQAAEPESNGQSDCSICYIAGMKESEGTIANFAGQRRECVVIHGQGVWRDY